MQMTVGDFITLIHNYIQVISAADDLFILQNKIPVKAVVSLKMPDMNRKVFEVLVWMKLGVHCTAVRKCKDSLCWHNVKAETKYENIYQGLHPEATHGSSVPLKGLLEHFRLFLFSAFLVTRTIIYPSTHCHTSLHYISAKLIWMHYSIETNQCLLVTSTHPWAHQMVQSLSQGHLDSLIVYVELLQQIDIHSVSQLHSYLQIDLIQLPSKNKTRHITWTYSRCNIINKWPGAQYKWK